MKNMHIFLMVFSVLIFRVLMICFSGVCYGSKIADLTFGFINYGAENV